MSSPKTSASCEEGPAANEASAPPAPPAPPNPLDEVQALLQEGRTQDVLTLVADLMANMNALQRQLNEVGAKRFKSREVVSSAQLGLLLTELKKAAAVAERDESLSKADDELQETVELEKMLMERDAEKKDKGKKKRKGGHKRKPFPPNIRREEKIIRVPDEKRGCPKCGKERTCIGYDVTETLDRVPAELVVRQDKQEKLCCKPCDGELCRAPAPDRVVKQGRLGIELVACLLVEKYHDGLPLHRQVQRFRRMGVDLPVSTLVDQVKHAAQAAKMLHEMAIEEVLASHVMHLDGTGLPVLDKAHRNGTRYGTLWGYVGDKVVSVFLYASTGKKKGQKPGELGPEDFLNRRTGFAVADASNLFDKSFERDDLIECGCNAHGRRGFVKALDGGDSRAALPIGAYSRLYSFEHQAKDLDDEARQKLREHKSKPVFDAILKWCQAYAPHEPPSSPLGRAIRYFINHHEALGRFIEDGAIPIDNSLIERQHVRVALTRKNFLFVGSDDGGHRAATVYTILGSCQLNDVDPVKYLADVLPRLARGVTREQARELLPHRWKAAQASA